MWVRCANIKYETKNVEVGICLDFISQYLGQLCSASDCNNIAGSRRLAHS
jgi:hypothetical protein